MNIFDYSSRPKSCPPLFVGRLPVHHGDASSAGKRRWSYEQDDDFEGKPLLQKPKENDDEENVAVVENLIRNKKELLTMISLMIALFSALCSYAMVAPLLPLEVSV